MTWPHWKYKHRVKDVFIPGYKYRYPILGVDIPPLDYPLKCGPMRPWEYLEPWLPSLRPAIDLGGVAVIIGKETEGTGDLVAYAQKLSQLQGRSVFLCSNMVGSACLSVLLLFLQHVCLSCCYSCYCLYFCSLTMSMSTLAMSLCWLGGSCAQR